jgi:hypothetical protein
MGPGMQCGMPAATMRRASHASSCAFKRCSCACRQLCMLAAVHAWQLCMQAVCMRSSCAFKQAAVCHIGRLYFVGKRTMGQSDTSSGDVGSGSFSTTPLPVRQTDGGKRSGGSLPRGQASRGAKGGKPPLAPPSGSGGRAQGTGGRVRAKPASKRLREMTADDRHILTEEKAKKARLRFKHNTSYDPTERVGRRPSVKCR